jgi:hypothetical protein
MLSTVFSSTDLAGLFHPTTTSEISTSGVSPGNQSNCLSAVRPLLSLAQLGRASPSGFCSDCRSVVRTRSVTSSVHSIPSCAFASSGFSPNTSRVPSHSLHSWPCPQHLTVVRKTAFSVSIDVQPFLLSPESLPRPSFVTCCECLHMQRGPIKKYLKSSE